MFPRSELITLPLLKEVTIDEIPSNARSSTPIISETTLTWSDVDLPRVEGVSYYEPRCLMMIFSKTDEAHSSARLNPPSERTVSSVYRANSSLTLCDAVDLLLGVDHTGLMPWEGSRQLLKWFGWILSRLPPEEDANIDKKEITRTTDDKNGCKIVELGAGCGFLSVALLAILDYVKGTRVNVLESASSQCSFSNLLFGMLSKASFIDVCVTDGNNECVELIQSNLDLYERVRKSRNDYRSSISASSCAFWWGCKEIAEEIINHGTNDSCPTSKTDYSDLVIISGDVVYGMEAVEPLVKAATDLATASTGSRNILWTLSWMARSLTRAQNISLFETLLKEVVNNDRPNVSRWVLKEVFLRKVAPEGESIATKKSPFEEDGQQMIACISPKLIGASRNQAFFEACAMDGCILCFSWIS